MKKLTNVNTNTWHKDKTANESGAGEACDVPNIKA